MFDPGFFAEQLSRDVDRIAKERYEGDRGKAFAFWVIRQLSKNLSDDEVELARGICESGGQGDEGIDGCWLESSKGPLFLIQCKWDDNLGIAREEAGGDGDSEDDGPADVTLQNYGKKPAQELWSGFQHVQARIHGDVSNTRPSQKLIQASALYKRAIEAHAQVRLLVVVAGKFGNQLRDEIDQCNAQLRADPRFQGHFADIYDFTRLGETYSDGLYPPPGSVLLKCLTLTEVPGGPPVPDMAYALSATCNAGELVRVRNEKGLNIYHSNFRFVIRNSPVRQTVLATLESPRDRRNFWRYNNGVTVVCSKAKRMPGGLELDGFQVVNGLQTIEVLHDFALTTKDSHWVDDVNVPVRIIPTSQPGETGSGPSLEERIAEYSNSQNPIQPRDLRSNDAIQKELAADMTNFGLRYQRKVGMYRKAFDVVDNVRVAQQALAFWSLKPKIAKNSRRLLFVFKHDGGYYEDVFVQGQTKAPWLLVPYFMFSNYEEWVDSVTSKGALTEYGNLLTLATVGYAFREVLPYELPGSVDQAGYEKLRSVVVRLRQLNRDERILREIWSPAFDHVAATVKREQQRLERMEGAPVPDRRVAVKLDFEDVRKHINKRSRRDLASRIHRLLLP